MYLALFRNGRQTMAEISASSDVPKQRAIEMAATVLDELPIRRRTGQATDPDDSGIGVAVPADGGSLDDTSA
jgi:hypothetical protein